MNNINITLREMLSDLLLNQFLYKQEISKITKIPTSILNQLLTTEVVHLRGRQEGNLVRLYQRLKSFEDRIEEYLVTIHIQQKFSEVERLHR